MPEPEDFRDELVLEAELDFRAEQLDELRAWLKTAVLVECRDGPCRCPPCPVFECEPDDEPDPLCRWCQWPSHAHR